MVDNNSNNSNNSNVNNNNTDDINEILAKSKKKSIQITVFTLFVIFVIITFSYFYNMRVGDYIEGNILKLPLSSGSKLDEQSLANPWKNANFTEQLLFRSLFCADSSLTLVQPSLCSSYDILDNGSTYVITLKDNLKWSDGVNLTVDDIVFSIETFIKCDDVNVNIIAAFNKIVGFDDFYNGKTDSIEGIIVEGNQITFNLYQRYNNFLLMLTQFVPFPKHILQDEDLSTFTSGHSFFVNDNPVCSGMYMSTGLDDDYNIVLVKNPYYEDNPPEIEKVILYWDYHDVDFDFYSTTDITQMVSYRSMRGFEEYFVDVYFYRYFVFNINGIEDDNGNVDETLQDVRIRQAIMHAIDAKTLLSDVYYDTGKIMYSGSFNVGNTQVYEYNPQKAQELLIEAGYDFDRPFTIIYYYTDATSYIFLQKVRQYLENIGLTVELVRSITTAELYEERQYDIMLKGLSAFNTENWYNEYISSNSNNLASVYGKAQEFDDLIDALNSSYTNNEFNEALLQLVELEQELIYKLPLFSLNQACYVNSNRLLVPDDMVFGNSRYREDLRIDEWKIKRD